MTLMLAEMIDLSSLGLEGTWMKRALDRIGLRGMVVAALGS